MDDVDGNVPDKYFDKAVELLDYLFEKLNIREDIPSHLFVILLPCYVLLQDQDTEQVDDEDDGTIGPSVYYDTIHTMVVCAAEYEEEDMNLTPEQYDDYFESNIIRNVLMFNLDLDGYINLTSEEEIENNVEEILLERKLRDVQ